MPANRAVDRGTWYATTSLVFCSFGGNADNAGVLWSDTSMLRLSEW